MKFSFNGLSDEVKVKLNGIYLVLENKINKYIFLLTVVRDALNGGFGGILGFIILKAL